MLFTSFLLIFYILCYYVIEIDCNRFDNSKFTSIYGGSYHQRPGPGLYNLGSTCYMSSVLQMLFYSQPFRKVVINSNFDKDSAGYYLQELFIKMGESKDLEPLDTTNLAKVFNLNTKIQEDAQEFLLKLINSLNGISDNVLGKMEQYLICREENFFKHRRDRFVDLSVEVESTGSLEKALKQYFAAETLDEYKISKEKTVTNVQKGSIIIETPDVLSIHLKRFRFDIDKGDMVKVADAFEFPTTLDITPFVKSDIVKLRGKEDNLYELQAIVMHEGTVFRGHYTCYARPDPWIHPDRWVHINDHILSEVEADVVTEEATGGSVLSNISPFASASSFLGGSGPSSRNAYILQYVRSKLR